MNEKISQGHDPAQCFQDMKFIISFTVMFSYWKFNQVGTMGQKYQGGRFLETPGSHCYASATLFFAIWNDTRMSVSFLQRPYYHY